MAKEPFHLSDQDILLAADGEGSRRAIKRARAHLTACWLCRSRLGELEQTISEFISLHRDSLDPQLPAAAGPRAWLRSRLEQAADERCASRGRAFLRASFSYRFAQGICAALLLSAVIAGHFLVRPGQHKRSTARSVSVASAAVPDHNLTPGATRPVSLGEVCSRRHEEVVSAVPDALRQRVFTEYGIVNPQKDDYEIDYLITPGLGGAEDIHNLWPEPSKAAQWNAKVKDALEERLHDLVCEGKLDLPTAQRALAGDWITAYKKYLSEDWRFSRNG